MLVIDIELYQNYFLFSALQLSTGKVVHVDALDAEPIDWVKIDRIMRSATTISFNGLGFDLPVMALGKAGASIAAMKRMADRIIVEDQPVWRLMREQQLEIPTRWDHIDLMEVAPGKSGLKIYGGRLRCPTLQDLPIEPSAVITAAQRQPLRDYCENDLHTTAALYKALKSQVDLRCQMSEQYGLDLRSKSDAQIAETVLKSELSKVTGLKYKAPTLPKGATFRYKDPGFIRFQTAELQQTFERILATDFALSEAGSVLMPKWLAGTKIKIGRAHYQMGIGGLHSCEKRQVVICKPNECLADFDVASYYPNIIIGQRLYPKNLGTVFLDVYSGIVDRRLAAKKAKDNVTANTLKIVVNGSFGKFGSKYSTLYSPDLLIQTTITGQLALLMLIEQMEALGVRVVSANTDGIVLHYPKALNDDVEALAFEWMLNTCYELERTDYRLMASRDVNNYVAAKTNGGCKGKGVFGETSISKNPETPIVFEAVRRFVADGTPLQQTINQCTTASDFASVRAVRGGGQWQGEYLGKAVRFYYAANGGAPITYRSNGNKVPKTDGAKPLMILPDTLPPDIDYQVYYGLAAQLLKDLGFNNA